MFFTILLISIFLNGMFLHKPFRSLNLVQNLLSDWLWVPLLYKVTCAKVCIEARLWAKHWWLFKIHVHDISFCFDDLMIIQYNPPLMNMTHQFLSQCHIAKINTPPKNNTLKFCTTSTYWSYIENVHRLDIELPCWFYVIYQGSFEPFFKLAYETQIKP